MALVVVSVALLGSDVVNQRGTDDGGDQLIGADPEWLEDQVASLSHTV